MSINHVCDSITYQIHKARVLLPPVFAIRNRGDEVMKESENVRCIHPRLLEIAVVAHVARSRGHIVRVSFYPLYSRYVIAAIKS